MTRAAGPGRATVCQGLSRSPGRVHLHAAAAPPRPGQVTEEHPVHITGIALLQA